jgi:hypothetical protein
MINQVLTRWSVPNGAADVTTVMNFDEGTPVAQQRAALATFWEDASEALNQNVVWTIEGAGRILDEATGTLVGTWADGPPITGAGASAGTGVVANATMLLVRWRAPMIVNGRRLQGRTFIPGASDDANQAGEVEPLTVAGLTASAQALVNAGVGFGIWSRPAGPRPGQFHEANDADLWREFAVQRNRRG